MFAWFTGSPVIVGNIWCNIFTGKYIDPTGYSTVINEHWTLLLPIIISLALVRRIKHLGWWRGSNLDSSEVKETVIHQLAIFYLLYLTFLTLGLQKMLMPIFPLLIILAVGNITSLYSIITAWRAKKLKLLKVK